MGNIKKASVLACYGKGLLSFLIRKITKSKYSHLALIISPAQIIEADGCNGYIKYTNINYYKNCADVYDCDFLTDDQRDEICKYAISKIGQKYDYFLLFVLILRYVCGIKIKYKDIDSDVCSELINDCYKSIEVLLSKKKFPIPNDVIKSKLIRKVGILNKERGKN